MHHCALPFPRMYVFWGLTIPLTLMNHFANKSMLNTKNKAIMTGQVIAMFTSLLAAAQIGYYWLQGDTFCLNQGCKVVEQLTRISPLAINLIGLFFFLTIYGGLRASKNQRRRIPRFIPPLLLAGLAVEGVLVGYQYLVAKAFCAYCLGVLASIVFLNLALGFRQMLQGGLLFAAVLLTMAGLHFNPATSGTTAFKEGVFASRPGTAVQPEFYLFYSSTCAHCKNVLTALKNDGTATVHFNPVDIVTSLELQGTNINKGYAPATNRSLLALLGLDQIPVLITTTPTGLSIVHGEKAIIAALSQKILAPASELQTDHSSAPESSQPIPGLESKDGCQVSTDCGDGTTNTSGGQTIIR